MSTDTNLVPQFLCRKLKWSSIKFFDTNCFLKVLKNWQSVVKIESMSCGQCDLSKRLVYMHSLKSIMNELKESENSIFSELEN